MQDGWNEGDRNGEMKCRREAGLEKKMDVCEVKARLVITLLRQPQTDKVNGEPTGSPTSADELGG